MTGMVKKGILLVLSLLILMLSGCDDASDLPNDIPEVSDTSEALVQCELPYYIDLSPGEDASEANRSWQGCPTIAVTKGGRLFAGWYTGGEYEPCLYNYNVLVQSDDGGATWSKPILTVGTDTENMMRNIDIQLWVTEDNVLWVTWVRSPYYETSVPANIRTSVIDYHKEFPETVVMMCKDPDAAVLVWEEPRTLCSGFLRNKPLITSTGRIIVPAYDYSGSYYMLRYSDDGGESFYDVTVCRKPDANVYDEIMVYEYEGTLHMLARTKRGYYAHARSADGGESWSTMNPQDNAPSTRFYIGTLSNGMLAYVRNVSDTERTGMKICLSADGGKTYAYEFVLDTRTDVSYPDLCQTEDGAIYIIYDRERDNRIDLSYKTLTSTAAKEILVCKLTVDDIISGDMSEGSYVQRVISKAQINTIAR